MSEILDRKSAQRRVERIRAFRQQLDELTRAGVLTLSAEQSERLDTHLKESLAGMAEQFDVDVSDSQKQISLGMRVLSTLGGLAFCAALILFFSRFWGSMTTPVQIAVLAGAPVLGLIAMDTVARREKALYFTGLIGLIVLAAFGLNLGVLGYLFNVLPTPNAFLAWGVFALIIAYNYRLRIPLFAGLVALLICFSATVTAWSGFFSMDFLRRPEILLPGGLLAALIPLVLPHRKIVDFPAVYHLTGLTCVLLALEFLAHLGHSSFINLAAGTVETIYRITGFAVSSLTIYLGIRRGSASLVNLGALFFAVYLFDRLISSWWDWMPKYLFFLIIGLLAVGLLAVFRKLRERARRVAA